MADKIPNLIVMLAIDRDTYRGYAKYEKDDATGRGYVDCRGSTVFDPFAKIEVERAKSDKNYVHLRFYNTNRYWARGVGNEANKIVADSIQPVEDILDPSCTLFLPKIYRDDFYFTHAYSKKHLRADIHDGRLYVDDKDDGHALVRAYSFGCHDWDTLVKLPEHVAFKGDNGLYLQAFLHDNKPYLQFSSSDPNDKSSAYQVILQSGGFINIKSEHFSKFLSVGDYDCPWIYANSNGADNDLSSFFWPIKIGGNIALRTFTYFGNSPRFTNRHTDEGKNDCLGITTTTITKEAILVVEELVLERNIYNVKYRDGRVFNEEPFVAGSGSATNDADHDASLSIKVKYEDTRSSSFTYSLSLKLGVKTTFEVGIPFIASGKIDISAEVTNTFEWGTVVEEKKAIEVEYTVVVPRKSQVTVQYRGTRGKCSVPFSYTQRDVRSTDGQIVTSQHEDGVFHGANYYSFHFDQPAFELIA